MYGGDLMYKFRHDWHSRVEVINVEIFYHSRVKVLLMGSKFQATSLASLGVRSSPPYVAEKPQ